MGSKNDPKDGKAAARTLFFAVLVYGVSFLVSPFLYSLSVSLTSILVCSAFPYPTFCSPQYIIIFFICHLVSFVVIL